MNCEILISGDYARRGDRMIRAMYESAVHVGVKVFFSTQWTAKSKNLMSYGLGHPIRSQWTSEHVRRGGRLIGWDLGYWDRDSKQAENAGMRLTIDDPHPWRHIRPMPPERWDARGVALRDDYDPDGPIILCGLGRKQRVVLGQPNREWEQSRLEEIKTLFPNRRIVYRPKRPEESIENVPLATGTIEETLRGASLLVTAHSNCAVDACIAGVPVICDDGAAYALYRDNPHPSPEQRLEFLRALAWFNWKPSEAIDAWKFLKTYLSA
jgi:hypothetical protein